MTPCSHDKGHMHALGATLALLGGLLIMAFFGIMVAIAAGWIR